MWTSRAAVLRQVGAPMTIETLEVGPLAAGDALVFHYFRLGHFLIDANPAAECTRRPHAKQR